MEARRDLKTDGHVYRLIRLTIWLFAILSVVNLTPAADRSWLTALDGRECAASLHDCHDYGPHPGISDAETGDSVAPVAAAYALDDDQGSLPVAQRGPDTPTATITSVTAPRHGGQASTAFDSRAPPALA